MSEPTQSNGFRELPQERTCRTCDWWCFGTWPANTCEKWEFTLCEIEAPDELISMFTGEPTERQLEELRREIENLGDA